MRRVWDLKTRMGVSRFQPDVWLCGRLGKLDLVYSSFNASRSYLEMSASKVVKAMTKQVPKERASQSPNAAGSAGDKDCGLLVFC